MAFQQVFLLLLLSVSARSQISLESCTVSLQCGKTNGLFQSTGTRNTQQQLRGPPGKRGPRGFPGPRGMKGEAAERCECDGISELRNEFQQLQERLTKTEAALYPKTCGDVMARHENDTVGVYTIYPLTGAHQGFQVLCDMVTDGGGWLIFQKREDGSENFNRGWDDYVNGFGSLEGEFWLGLEKIHQITSSGEYEMRIDMEDFEGNKTYAAYGGFSVGEGTDYEIIWRDYAGPAGNGMQPSGTKFTTKDFDQDTNSGNCAKRFRGGWWFNNCHAGTTLNGFYHGGPHRSYADGVNWKLFRGYNYSLKNAEMKIKKL